MLHELLLALNGFAGGIFVENDNRLEVICDLPFIHSSEVFILNRLCHLATYYKKFLSFIKLHQKFPSLKLSETAQECNPRPGLYIRAFCCGLNKILEPYRQSLLKLEQEALADPYLSLSHLQASLEEYQMLFPSLADVIEQIVRRKAHGCAILDILHKNSSTGLPIVRTALTEILHYCHGLLYKQLSAWLLHGLLLDQYQEFFIQMQKRDIKTSSVQESAIMLKPAHSAPDQFLLCPDLLPSYISGHVVAKILFVGESVQLFGKKDLKWESRQKESILESCEKEFIEEIQQLQMKTFNLSEFEAVIDKIRVCVAEYLWTLIVEESDLMGHLKIMKDFFLLGRGELFLVFIDHAQALLQIPPHGNTEHDINVAFQQAARKVLFEDDSFLERFHLTVDIKTKSKNKSKSVDDQTVEAGWNSLGMKYSIEWPLHVFFSTSVLERYNIIFKFLLAVKRVQLELQQCWALQMQNKHVQQDEGDFNKWQLRTHMGFLIDNLQYYLQVDVLESHYTMFLEKIKATKDFEAIQMAHDYFITSILSQSFLLMKPVSQSLREILDLCHSFCMLVNKAASPMTEQEQSQMNSIAKAFRCQSSLLFKILSSVRSQQSGTHLAQFLLRIDFNKYFTKAGGQLGR